MLTKIAWRNIWRSRTRSFVVIGAIAIGIWALIFLLAFSEGMMYNFINSTIANETSHLQVHHPKFGEDNEFKYFIENPSSLKEEIAENPAVKSVTSRILSNGMMTSSKGARGIQIKGINPTQESEVTGLENKIIEGDYFGEKKNTIIIGKRLAEKLNVKVRKKVVLTFQDINGEINQGAFRIAGLYQTKNKVNDETIVYVKNQDIRRLTGLEEGAHEIAILLNDLDNMDSVQTELSTKTDNLIENYKEIAPDLDLFDTQLKLNRIIMTIIVMFALIFGIINTMLMAVLERMKELGMLMSIGMNKVKVFFMVVLETIMLALVGAPIGLLLGFLTVLLTSKQGISLEKYSESMQQFGISDLIYPSLDASGYIQIAIAVIITAVLASIYPAFKAVRLKPVEALRKI